MLQVPSSACSTLTATRRPRRLRVLVAAGLTAALTCGVGSAAMADPLTDRHAELQRNVAGARAEVGQSTAALQAASDALEASTRQLDEARAALEATRADLAAARTLDAEVAARLMHEQQELRRAQAETAKAVADVEAQQRLIAQAAREAYQGRPELSGIVVVLGGRTPAELGQRLQWDTTIFNTTAHRLDELTALQTRQQEAERVQAAAEAAVAAEKAKAAENVARIERLEAAAVTQQADVAALVARNEQFQRDAQAALDADNAEYAKLVAEEGSVQAELGQRAARQLASGAARNDIAKLVASGVVSTDPATYPLVESGRQLMLSPQGFIRPVKARNGSPFGQRFHPILKYWRMHNGTDFGAACGTPLYAAQSGTVVKAGPQGGFGNYVVVDHGVVGGASIMTGYAHMESIAVRPGQRVELGQHLGAVGTTGLSTGCHLHLQVYRNGTPADPLAWVP